MKTETVYITCDLCNAVDASEIRFSAQGGDYTIDLCETHMGELRTIFGVYVTAGRKVKPAPYSVRRDKPKSNKPIADELPKADKAKRGARKRHIPAEVKEGAE